MENQASQTVAEIILAWIPFLVYLGTWIWGVAVFKRYARSREAAVLAAKVNAENLVETNRQIVAALHELRKREA